MEARLTPTSDSRQKLLSRRLATVPTASIHGYTDYFGNSVECFSVVHRHRELVLEVHSEVETTPQSPPPSALAMPVSEARQIWRTHKLELFEWLMPSPAIPMSAAVNRLANQFFPPGTSLGSALRAFMTWMKETFRYAPGETSIDTPVAAVLQARSGVCQDFAQVMIAVLRSAEIPSRYVTGYIETEEQRRVANDPQQTRGKRLVGASESHAWIEVALPGRFWWGLDPTNDCEAGERHVKLAAGRDFHDSTPTRGVFKGTQTEKLSVSVEMVRQLPAYSPR